MDRIIETQDGYDVIVDGKTYGTWRSKAEASGGLQVEQRRAAARAAKALSSLPGLPNT